MPQAIKLCTLIFAPQGRHVAPMGVKFGVEEKTEGVQEGTEGPLLPSVPSSTPNFTSIGAKTRVKDPQN